jgi:glycosyltransferase involved in cell wall biosynthesis
VRQGLVREENTSLIRGSGVDTDYFQSTPEADGPPVVVMASRMLWDKGVEDLVAAARLLNEWEVPGAVTLVGAPDPGNPHSISEDKLLEWDREGVIRWLGHRDDMTSIYAQSHLVVLPTTYYEGLPRSLLEGAACSRPLVATDIPGCREIVLDGENGFLVPPHDPKAIAEAIRKLIVNPELRREMGLKSRSIVLEHFSAKNINSQTIEVYDALLGEH